LQELLGAKEEAEKHICCYCREMPESAHKWVKCPHITCYKCFLSHKVTRGWGDMACPICLEPIRNFPKKLPNKVANRIKKKGRPKTKPETWIDQLRKEGRSDVPASAKTIAFKAQVLNWLAADKNVKIIVFSEWRGMLDVLASVCQAEEWSYEKVDGSVTFDERDNRLEEFRTGNATILLATKRVGGVGLNLTEATRMIIMDPWWNAAVEAQAFARIRRIGQTKKTQLTRFYIEGGREQAMMEMQDRKEKDIQETWSVCMVIFHGSNLTSLKDSSRLHSTYRRR
jgi:SNF2 family DNA or RNA helicase